MTRIQRLMPEIHLQILSHINSSPEALAYIKTVCPELSEREAQHFVCQAQVFPRAVAAVRAALPSPPAAPSATARPELGRAFAEVGSALANTARPNLIVVNQAAMVQGLLTAQRALQHPPWDRVPWFVPAAALAASLYGSTRLLAGPHLTAVSHRLGSIVGEQAIWPSAHAMGRSAATWRLAHQTRGLIAWQHSARLYARAGCTASLAACGLATLASAALGTVLLQVHYFGMAPAQSFDPYLGGVFKLVCVLLMLYGWTLFVANMRSANVANRTLQAYGVARRDGFDAQLQHLLEAVAQLDVTGPTAPRAVGT